MDLGFIRQISCLGRTPLDSILYSHTILMANELSTPLASRLVWKFKTTDFVGITRFDARKFAVAANSFQDPYPSGQEVCEGD